MNAWKRPKGSRFDLLPVLVQWMVRGFGYELHRVAVAVIAWYPLKRESLHLPVFYEM